MANFLHVNVWSDGPEGAVVSIGAILMSATGHVLDSFSGSVDPRFATEEAARTAITERQAPIYPTPYSLHTAFVYFLKKKEAIDELWTEQQAGQRSLNEFLDELVEKRHCEAGIIRWDVVDLADLCASYSIDTDAHRAEIAEAHHLDARRLFDSTRASALLVIQLKEELGMTRLVRA